MCEQPMLIHTYDYLARGSAFLGSLDYNTQNHRFQSQPDLFTSVNAQGEIINTASKGGQHDHNKRYHSPRN